MLEKIYSVRNLELSSKQIKISEILQNILDLQKKGNFKESLNYCEILNKNGYKTAEFLHLYGLALRGNGEINKAIEKIELAIEEKEKDATILNSLGVLHLQNDQAEKALEIFNKATKQEPDLFDLWNNLGSTLRKLERYPEAEVALRRARKIDKNRYEPLLNMALILVDLRDYKKAEKFMDKVLEMAKPMTESLLIKRLSIANKAENLKYIEKNFNSIDPQKLSLDEQVELDQIWAKYLEINNRADEAILLMEKWLGKKTKHEDQLLTIIGMLYAKAGRLKEGIEFHKKLLEKAPDHITGRWNLSLLQMLNGEVKESFKNYEARWQWREFPSMRRRFGLPRWRGESLTGKKLLVWREQGIGDEIRFSSLVPDLKPLGGQITIECSSKMVNLFRRSFAWATVRVEGGVDCIDNIEYENYDYQIPIGSLTTLLRNSVEDFYKLQKPWFPRLHQAELNVRNRLAARPNQLVIGICWRSSNQAPSRNRHYLLVEELAPLRMMKNTIFVTTQYDECLPEVERVRDLGLPLYHYVNVNQKDDLLSAVGLIGSCDLIISANVSVGDLASALGVPVIRIGPKNEPIRLGAENIPWYPTCKYYEMQAGQGIKVIDKITKDLPNLIEWLNTVTTSERKVEL